MRKFLIWGAGGHGKVVLDLIRAVDPLAPVAFIDNDGSRATALFCGCRVFSSLDELAGARYPTSSAVVVAIGSNQTRARCAAAARDHGWALATVVHPSAVVSPSARLGAGTVVMPRAVVNAGAEIGENCIVNTAAVVEHDCRIGDHAHLSPGVLLGGGATVEQFVHMGIGAIALPGAVIESSAVVGAGAVVLRRVSRGQTVVGVPARNTVKNERPLEWVS